VILFEKGERQIDACGNTGASRRTTIADKDALGI
jgi:hypothetical protein